MNLEIESLASALTREHVPDVRLGLRIGAATLVVESNSRELLEELRGYFGELVVEAPARPDVAITALEAPPPSFDAAFVDWPREAGKRGKKEAYADVSGGRIVLKMRTGMQFLLGKRVLLAVGPCLDNANQIINFINAQYMASLLHGGWALCHAAGVASGERGLAIAARAGAGKSTLAMHLMSAGLSFVSNDRLLVRASGGGSEMAGIPKLPRVNPGTLLGNPDLSRLLDPDRARALQSLPPDELWELEEKYDVPIEQVYGPDRCRYRVRMAGLLVLNWSRESGEDARLEPVDLAARPDLLSLVMKSPGVFHRDPDGGYLSATAELEPGHYLEQLVGVTVMEARGRVDFPLAVARCRRWLEGGQEDGGNGE